MAMAGTAGQRRYERFVWYLGKMRQRVEIKSMGFRLDTGREVSDVPDDLEIRPSTGLEKEDSLPPILVGPSREATLSMMHFLVGDAMDGRQWGDAGMPGEVRGHPWMEEWMGLYEMEVPCKEADARGVSWWCIEWARGA